MTTDKRERPSVLYVCVHNAGRSQIAAAYTRSLSGGAVEVRSSGSEPADRINPAVREALLDDGIDISAETPKILTTDAVQASDVVITMGCGDTCPLYPGQRYEDWSSTTPLAETSPPSAPSVRTSRNESLNCSSPLTSPQPCSGGLITPRVGGAPRRNADVRVHR